MSMFDDDSNFIYILKMMGQKVIINDKEEQVLISNYKDKKIDYKKMKAIVPFNTGNIVEYQGVKWIITSEISKTNTIYKATMQKAEQSFKMYIEDILEEIPVIIEVGTQKIDKDQYMNRIAGSIKLTVQDNITTKKIKYDDRIIIMGTPYEVTAFTSENKGLRYIYLDKTLFNKNDDNKELEIADYYKYNAKDVYKIEANDLILNVGETKKIDYKLYKNDIEVIDSPVFKIKKVYNTPPLNVVTVDAFGNVTGLKEGADAIIISYKEVSKSINITVVPANLPLTISGQDFIKWKLKANYTITNAKGVVTYLIKNENIADKKPLATIFSTVDNVVTVEANRDMNVGYVILKAVDENLNEGVKRIEIKSLY